MNRASKATIHQSLNDQLNLVQPNVSLQQRLTSRQLNSTNMYVLKVGDDKYEIKDSHLKMFAQNLAQEQAFAFAQRPESSENEMFVVGVQHDGLRMEIIRTYFPEEYDGHLNISHTTLYKMILYVDDEEYSNMYKHGHKNICYCTFNGCNARICFIWTNDGLYIRRINHSHTHAHSHNNQRAHTYIFYYPEFEFWHK